MVHVEGSASAIESARRRSTLVTILTSAGIDGDIVNDVADACEIKEYTVLHLASEELSIATIAHELYLTDDEAEKLQTCSQAEMKRLGVSHADGGELPGPLEEDDEAEEVPMEEEKDDTEEVPVEEEQDDAEEVPVEEEDSKVAPSPSPPDNDDNGNEDGRSPDASSPTNGLMTPPPAPAPTPASVCDSVSTMSTISVVNTPAEPTPTSKPSRPMSAPPKSTKSLPSYAKPTSSAMKKIKEEEALAREKAMKSRPTSASVKVSSSLLRPTAASQAYSTGKYETAKSRLNSTSAGLDTTPRNRGPTTPRPFNLSGYAKKENVMSTDELNVAMAKAKMQALKDERHKTSRVMSAPPKQTRRTERPLTEFKPFSLTSVALHEKAKNAKEQQAMDEKKKDEQARRFKARNASYGKGKTYQDVRSTVEKKLSESKTFTVGQGPKFHSDERVELHKQLDAEKRIKEAERKVQEAEAERLAKEQEELEIKEMRKQLQFHATSVPDFSTPFQPDFSDSPAPTQAKTPRFATDMRARKSAQGESDPAIGVPSADNLKYFASTLRGAKSPTVTSSAQKSISKDVHVEVRAQ